MPYRRIAALCLLGAMPAPAWCADIVSAPPPAAPPRAEAPAPAGTTLLLKRDTPVELIATREISTAKVTAGARFALMVDKAVTVGDRIAIPYGAIAYGEVVAATKSGGLGKRGELNARLLFVQVGDVQIPIDGAVHATGQGSGSEVVAVLLTGFVGLFNRGNSGKIKAGERVSAFVVQDVPLALVAIPAHMADVPVMPETAAPKPVGTP